MAKINLSARKRIRQSQKKYIRNKGAKTRIKTLFKKVKNEPTEENLKTFYKLVDKAVSKGVLKRNKGNRLKSRAAHLLNKGG